MSTLTTPARYRWSLSWILVTWCIRVATVLLLNLAVTVINDGAHAKTIAVTALLAAGVAWCYYVRHRWCR